MSPELGVWNYIPLRSTTPIPTSIPSLLLSHPSSVKTGPSDTCENFLKFYIAVGESFIAFSHSITPLADILLRDHGGSRRRPSMYLLCPYSSVGFSCLDGILCTQPLTISRAACILRKTVGLFPSTCTESPSSPRPPPFPELLHHLLTKVAAVWRSRAS